MAAGESVSGSDFFLEFGSDAAPFSDKLATDLTKGVTAVEALKRALSEYEEVAGRVRGKGDITFNFEGLTAAADRIEAATTQFQKSFGSQLGKLTNQVAGLSEVLATAARGIPTRTDATPRTPRVAEQPPTEPPPRISTPRQRAAEPVVVAPAQPQGPPLAQYPPKPVPPKDPYGGTQPKGLEDWPAAPRNSNDPRQQGRYAREVESFIAKNPALADVARKYDSAMTAFGQEVKSFTVTMAEWRKSVAEIDKANQASISRWETETGQKYNEAPVNIPARRTLREVPTEPVDDRPAPPVRSEALAAMPKPPGEKASLKAIDRYEDWLAANPEVAKAAEEYEQAMQAFEKADAAFKKKYTEWQKAKEVIERANGEAATFNANIDKLEAAARAQERQVSTPAARQEPEPAAAATVTPQDLAAVRAQKKAMVAEEAKAVAELEAFNSGVASSSKAVEEALSALVDKITASAGEMPPPQRPDAAGDASGGGVQQVEVVNGESAPVPVVVMGGEEQAHVGKAAKGGEKETRRATTATAAARVDEQLGAKEASGSKVEPAVIPVGPASRSSVEEVGSQAVAAATAPLANALNETVRTLEQWNALSPARRERLERNGVNQQAYLSGAPLGAAGGKNPVPSAQKHYDDVINRAISEHEASGGDIGSFNPYNHPGVVEAESRLHAALAEQAVANAARVKRREDAERQGQAASAPTQPVAQTPPPRPAGNIFSDIGSGRRDKTIDSGRQAEFAALQPQTQRALSEARDRLVQLSQQEMTDAVRASMEQTLAQAAHAYRSDPAAGLKYLDPTTGKQVNNRSTMQPTFGNSSGSWRAFADFMGTPHAREFLRTQVIPNGALADQFNHRTPATPPAGNSARVGRMTDAELAENAERLAKYNEVLATTHGKVTPAALAHAKAEMDLGKVMKADTIDAEAYVAALLRLQSTERALGAAREEQAKDEGHSTQQSAYSRFKGSDTTFGQDLRRHLANTALNQVGWTLAFVGFDKMKQLVETGIQAQAVYVRLQASLDANGVAAGNLVSELAKTSATTATPLGHVMEAAAELSGTFKNVGDIEFGAKIASQLANISQGTLSAQQAAVGLRDVFAAFGDEWAKSGTTVQEGLQATGDQIAHLSQLTGVSVKDITEGTTQIAAEAHEFGLNQGQTATLAAYIAKGTGETGEESAAQASRMFATLYNGKTQGVLEGTRLYKNGKLERNADGSPKTLATAQQFAQGDLGGILANIAGNWSQLSPRQRQEITAQMGTGIQARAFEALVGGGKNVADELKNQSNDSGALARQNQAFLQTVEGQIKQMDEDFQNLGSTLQRIHALDAVGLLAKSLDTLFKSINASVGWFASVMNKNPLTSGILRMSTVLLEAAAVWKIFGSSISGTLLRRQTRNLVPLNQAEIDNAAARGIAPPRPAYRFGDVYGASRSGLVNPVYRTRSLFRDVAAGNRADLSPRGLAARGDVYAATRAEADAIAARTKAEVEVTAATEKQIASEVAAQEARDALALAERQGAASEEELNTLRRAQLVSAEAMASAQAKAAAAITALSAAAAAVVVTEEELAVANQKQAAVRSGGFAAGFSGMRSGLGSIAPIAALLLAAPVGNAIAGGESRGGGNRGFAGSIASGSLYGAGIGGFMGPGGAVVGGAVGGLVGGAMGVWDARRIEHSLPSHTSNQAFLDLMNEVYDNPHSKTVVSNARKRLGFGNTRVGIDKLDKFTSVDDVNKWADDEQKFIQAHAKAIESAGGNNAAGKAAIKASLDTLTKNLQADAARRIGVIMGLSKIDQLNAAQLGGLNNIAGTIAGLDANTLTTQHGAVLTLLQNVGLPTSSNAYKSLVTALGSPSPTNQLGLNDKGELGQYTQDGKWHPATAQETAGISPTEGSKLPQLGAGPGTEGNKKRLGALQQAYQAAIDAANAKLNSPNLSGQDRIQYQQDLVQATTGYQQTTQTLYGAPIQQAQAQAAQYAAVGGTPGVAKSMGLGTGGDATAVDSLRAANRDLVEYNKHLESTDPQYWQNLQEIQANKLQLAQLQNQPALNALNLAAARATDATEQANIKYKQAVKQLGIDTAGGASTKQLGDDRAGVAAARLGQTQVGANVAEATAQANMAGVENNVVKAYLQYADAKRLEALYAKGGPLADAASEQNAIGQAKQAQISIADAIESQAQSAYSAAAAWKAFNGDQMGALYEQLSGAWQAYNDAVARYKVGSSQANAAWQRIAEARSAIRQQEQSNAQATFDVAAAIDNLHGDAVAAAQEQLLKAQQAYDQAVLDFGKNSSQARQAYANEITAEQTKYAAQLDLQNSALDLQVAQFDARGQAGDAEKAAQDKVKQAQNAISSYLSHGGKKGTAQYDKLEAQLVSARRNAFDVHLQAQLDTLDFQKETYKITGEQEVEALQQILKNKQLTLAEQRAITLKIKDLQTSIREQLTNGGLNIPSNITLPTAYDVRRSLGAGFGGNSAGASQQTVNNNNQQVQINNQVTTDAQISRITRAVIDVINSHTASQARASTSTGRLVGTR